MRSAAGCWSQVCIILVFCSLVPLFALDQAGASASEPPIAAIEGIVPFPPTLESTLTFKGAGYGTGDSISRYVWDFDDGTLPFNSTSTGVTNHKYTAPGTYYPNLKVQDDSGTWSEPAVAKVIIPPSSTGNDAGDEPMPLYEQLEVQAGVGVLLVVIVLITVVRGIGRRRSRSPGQRPATPLPAAPATPDTIGAIGLVTESNQGPSLQEYARPQSSPTSPEAARPEATGPAMAGYSAVNYEKAHVVYKVKVDNKAPYPLSDIRVRPYLDPHLFTIVGKEERTLPLLKRGEAKTVTFHLRPKGECGNTTLAARVTYYDTKKEKHKDIDVKPRETSIVCPLLKSEEVDEQTWRRNVADMMRVEETTDKIPMDGRSLFHTVSEVLQDLNLFKVNPILVKGRVFRARTKFWAKGAVESKGLGYAANVEVIGGERRSKLILQAYSRNEESLIGFYHKILDEIEKRTSVRDYLDDDLTVQHFHGDIRGDIVGGSKVEMKDSVVSRSNIGGEKFE